jgi:acid stress-induced BolA-like protein IbaG/YrbA
MGDAKKDDIISEAEIEGITASQTYETLGRLKRNGMIYEPLKNMYRVAE